jgi:hypothetical protein
LTRLSQLTQSDLAANSQATGQDDWSLDYHQGTVTTALALSQAIQNNWVGSLATFTVTTTNDTGAGSLRAAITSANAAGGADVINFNIGAGGLQTITLNTALPQITEAVTIDGTTQAGWTAGTPLIELNGTNVTSGFGLDISGLIINRFGSHGIFIRQGNGHVVSGNFIGTDAAGNADLGNGGNGIQIEADNVLIGGTTLADRNVISGNAGHGIEVNLASDTRIEGNYIGTNKDGNSAIGNSQDGITLLLTYNTSIGGDASKRNLISGNNYNGIGVYSSAQVTTITGNWIGLDSSGLSALGNGQSGIATQGTWNLQIGDGTLTGRNVLSGNQAHGIYLNSSFDVWIEGNFIGRNVDDTAIVGNTSPGIAIDNGSNRINIGGITELEENLITGNNGGIVTYSNNSDRIGILRNTITDNVGLAIDLENSGVTNNDVNDIDTGSNSRQNFPVLTSASISGANVRISGNFNSLAATDFLLHFYYTPTGTADSTGHGELAEYLGALAVSTSASGLAAFSINYPRNGLTAGGHVSATASRIVDAPLGIYETSEVSANVTAANAPGFVISAVSGNTSEAGGTATFTVSLNTAPTGTSPFPSVAQI